MSNQYKVIHDETKEVLFAGSQENCMVFMRGIPDDHPSFPHVWLEEYIPTPDKETSQ